MKKRIIITGIVVLLTGLLAGGVYGWIQWKKARTEEIEATILQIHYKQQNQSFGMGASVWYSGYQGYDEIDETELYVRLAAYESWNKQEGYEVPEVTLEDIKDYLSDEYNEDGSLRVSYRPENIQAYMDWYFEGGDGDIEEYWVDLGKISLDYYGKHPEISMIDRGEMTVKQLQELINKYNDPAYEINAEIMGEQE